MAKRGPHKVTHKGKTYRSKAAFRRYSAYKHMHICPKKGK